jgi:protein SCO1/2
MRLIAPTFAGLLMAGLISGACAHDGVEHATQDEAAAHAAEAAAPNVVNAPNTSGFPDVVGGEYHLVDQFGNKRSSRDPAGHYQMIFFGYASCKAICSVALPRMAQAVEILAAKGIAVTPLLITVDPERDTQSAIRKAIPDIHPRLIGLTGSEEALNAAYKAFSVEKKLVYEHPDEGPIYAHGTFVYLTGPDGAFKTLMPPVLGPERMAEIVASHVSGKAIN